nr:MAG TPA: hypothetical protein [Caudoviricetes sp.]
MGCELVRTPFNLWFAVRTFHFFYSNLLLPLI